MLVNLRYFTYEEFLTQPGDEGKLPPKLLPNLEDLAIRLDALRAWWGAPILITSGYRSIEHNRKIGGAIGSLHCEGRAVDCFSEPFDDFKKFCNRHWLGGVGLYSAHVHLDTGVYRRWEK